jgi:putative membrane protein
MNLMEAGPNAKVSPMTEIRNLMFRIVAAFVGSILVGCAFFQQVLPGLTLSDANVVGLLDSIDEGEMDAAQLAQTQASDPEVQAFAGRVLHEHRDLIEANGRLAAQLSLEPERPSLASHFKQAHEQAMRSLRAMSGAAFDRAYVRYEIQQHVQAFNVLEAAAESEDNVTLKQELVRTGPDLLSHISAARALERHLGSERRPPIASR